MANNQRILHNFIFGEIHEEEIGKLARTYFPHRTKANLSYRYGEIELNLRKIQIEIDLTLEYEGKIYVFEAKSGKPKSFAIYQIYHPFLYYHLAKSRPAMKGKIQEIYGVYVVRERSKSYTKLSIWMYFFRYPLNAKSIYLEKSCTYKPIAL